MPTGPSRTPWRVAITKEDLRRKLTEIVAGIAQALADVWGDASAPGDLTKGFRVATDGALFLDYYERSTGDERFRELSVRLLDIAAERLADQVAARPALFGGYAGVGFAFQQIVGGDSIEDADDCCAEIDASLLEILQTRAWQGDYDLIGGLVGLGAYLLERQPRPAAVEGLALVERLLADTSTQDRGGTTWMRPPELLPEWQRQLAPKGYYNLGMAHGIPGVLSLLALMHQRGLASARGIELLREGTRWMRSCRLPAGRRSQYPIWISVDADKLDELEGSRFGWCYGDPGPAMALLHAGRAFGDRALEQEGIELLVAGGQGSDDAVETNDACLCHGATGLLAVFLRAWNTTGDPRLLPMIDRWVDSALRFYAKGRWPGGFARWSTNHPASDSAQKGWQPDVGFLTGVSGIGLAVLAAISDVEPRWDRLLMLS